VVVSHTAKLTVGGATPGRLSLTFQPVTKPAAAYIDKHAITATMQHIPDVFNDKIDYAPKKYDDLKALTT